MKLALIQLEGADLTDYRRTEERIYSLACRAADTGADLVILPEAAFPACFIGQDLGGQWEARVYKLLERLSELAGERKIYIGCGVALPEAGGYYNTFVVFNREGRQVARSDKSNLWHSDRKYFRAGTRAEVFDTEFGRIGVMICADGRIPEIARLLRLQGAWLILDAVNLMASAEEASKLSNPQYQYMLKARARENGVYIAVCDKCGGESGAGVFLGRSMVIDPAGKVLGELPADREEILTLDIEPEEELPPLLRRPGLYDELTTKTENLPVYQDIHEEYDLNSLETYTAVARFPFDSPEEYVEKALHFIKLSVMLDARLVVLPPMEAGLRLTDAQLDRMAAGLPAGAFLVAGDRTEDDAPAAKFLTRLGVFDEAAATHGPEWDGETEIRAVSLFPGFKVAALFDNELLPPEPARVAMLQGADAVLWFDTSGWPLDREILMTRATENMIYVVRSSSCCREDLSLIVHPLGHILGTTFPVKEQLTSAMIHGGVSKMKEVVPGTNVVEGRIPAMYERLTRE